MESTILVKLTISRNLRGECYFDETHYSVEKLRTVHGLNVNLDGDVLFGGKYYFSEIDYSAENFDETHYSVEKLWTVHSWIKFNF